MSEIKEKKVKIEITLHSPPNGIDIQFENLSDDISSSEPVYQDDAGLVEFVHVNGTKMVKEGCILGTWRLATLQREKYHNQVGDIIKFPMRCMIIIRHSRQFHK